MTSDYHLEHHPKTMVGWRAVIRQFPCDVCGAQPGEDCRTYAGHRTYTPHAPRSRLASSYHWRDPEDHDAVHPE